MEESFLSGEREPQMKQKVTFHPERQAADWQMLAEREGIDAAKLVVVNQLTAAAIYLEDIYGPRWTYNLFQSIADELVVSPRANSTVAK
jgi:hypothetical protein